MPSVAILFDCIQQRIIDAVKVKDFLNRFCDGISSVRKVYEEIELIISEPPNKRKCGEHLNNRIAALEVCDIIVNSISDRFQFSGHLCASKLFFVNNFKEYDVKFPDSSHSPRVSSNKWAEIENRTTSFVLATRFACCIRHPTSIAILPSKQYVTHFLRMSVC